MILIAILLQQFQSILTRSMRAYRRDWTIDGSGSGRESHLDLFEVVPRGKPNRAWRGVLIIRRLGWKLTVSPSGVQLNVGRKSSAGGLLSDVGDG